MMATDSPTNAGGKRELPAAGHLDSIFEQVVTDRAGQVRWGRALPSLHLAVS